MVLSSFTLNGSTTRCDDGAARNAETALCRQSAVAVHVESVRVSGQGEKATLDVTWDGGRGSKFPVLWLRAMAPLVAAEENCDRRPASRRLENKGWTTETLEIPGISYHDLFREGMKQEELNATILKTLDMILLPSSPGIIKIVDLPSPNIEEERKHTINLNTLILKRLFGSVFIHPIRGPDKTFNVSSHSHDSTRKVGLANYDTTQILPPHTDHTFYDNPIQVMGFYGLEGKSVNTWTSALAALETLKEEDPKSYDHLCNSTMAVGRVSRFYGNPLFQATVDTLVTMQPDSSSPTTDPVVKRVRWHPNLTGSLLCPYEAYAETRKAHQVFQRILQRDTHQIKKTLKPGDLYIWDNFRVLHGREKVFKDPRTGVGQTVPEQVVHDRYRSLCIERLAGIVNEEWLVHMPMVQLREIVGFVEKGYFKEEPVAMDKDMKCGISLDLLKDDEDNEEEEIS